MRKYRVSHIYRSSLLVVTSVVMSVALVQGCSKGNSAKMPVIKPPVVKMPSPNAYDYFMTAGKSLVDANDIKRAANPEDQSKVFTDSDIAALVAKNQTALDNLRKGLKCEYRQPFKYGMDAAYPEYDYYRKLSYLLALEGQVKVAKGDWGGAVESYQDGLLLGELVTHNDGNMLGRLVGIACQRRTCEYLWDAIPHLTSAQAKAAVDRMQEIQKHHFPIQESLTGEKNAQLLFLQDCFSGKCKDMKHCADMPDSAKSRVYSDYVNYMDQCIKNVQMSYASKPAFPEIQQTENPLKLANGHASADFLLFILCTDGQRYWSADTCNRTGNDLLTTALALQAYHTDYGNYPVKLSELCPDYLKSIPDDLFALNKPLGYRKDGAKYILWSFGPDCVDNNGVPAVDPKAKSNQPSRKYYVDTDSKGDIVAGINM